MEMQKVVVKYRDGSEAFTHLTQYSLSQFAVYAQSKGWSLDIENPGLIGIIMIRFQAWAELFSDPSSPRPGFEKWDTTVTAVEPVEGPKPVDPTQMEASEG